MAKGLFGIAFKEFKSAFYIETVHLKEKKYSFSKKKLKTLLRV
jgi:hypothetical protein